MTTDLVQQDRGRWVAPMDADDAAAALAHVLGTGDLYQLTNEQRVAHYINLCRSIGVSPLSRPYQWIEFKESENGPAVLTLYFKPTAAAQVLRNHHVSVHYPRREIVGELFVCEAHGMTPDGREGVGTKYLPLTGKYGKLTGRQLSNAFMSAETGALRRLALNMGLASGLDPDEQGTVRTVYVDGTGAILEHPTEEQRHLVEHPEVARAIGEPTYETTAARMPEIQSDLPDQCPRPETLQPRWRPASPKPSFRRSDEDVRRLLAAFHAAVNDTSLADDEARHRYFAQWTAGISGWPAAKQTASSRTFFERATDAEAADLLAHTRAIVEGERQAVAEQAGTPWPDADAADDDGEPF